MSQPCQICDNEFNQSYRRSVTCPYCEFEACRTCCETYVLGGSEVKCMNPPCGREWTRQHIRNAFTKTFMDTKLKKRREEILFDIERALLPATQPVVERHIMKERLQLRLNDIQRQSRELGVERYRIQMDMYRLNNNQTSVERVEFIKKCPDTECRGFLSSQWKCGLCEKWACNACHEIKGATRDSPHECNPETVATVSLLANDTRPCPNCRTGIFKIDGCDQMWCTQCHTAFNWRTGRIEANVHNPHYFEWLRRNGNNVPRAPGDVPCQQNEMQHNTYRELRTAMTRHVDHYLTKICSEFMEDVIRHTLHMRYTIMTRYEVPANREAINETLRIAYMRNQINEMQLKTSLQRNEKKYAKSREIHNVLEILLNTITSIVYRFIQHLHDAPLNNWTLDILEEIDPIVDYVNECLRETSKTYSSKVIQFSNKIRVK